MELLISAFKWLQIVSVIRIADGSNERNNSMQDPIAPAQTWAWPIRKQLCSKRTGGPGGQWTDHMAEMHARSKEINLLDCIRKSLASKLVEMVLPLFSALVRRIWSAGLLSTEGKWKYGASPDVQGSYIGIWCYLKYPEVLYLLLTARPSFTFDIYMQTS